MNDAAQKSRFTELLTRARTRFGSYRAVAEQLDVAHSYLYDRESGRRKVRRLDVLALERLLQIGPRESSWQARTVRRLRAAGYRAACAEPDDRSEDACVTAWGRSTPELDDAVVEEMPVRGGDDRSLRCWRIRPASSS